MCLVPQLNYNSALTYYYRMGMWGLVLGTREPIIALDINLRHCCIVSPRSWVRTSSAPW